MHPMFVEGLTLMLTGVAVVFAFLWLLVGVISLMSKAVLWLVPEDAAPPATPRTPPAVANTKHPPPPDAATLAVIREAVRRHRAAGH